MGGHLLWRLLSGTGRFQTASVTGCTAAFGGQEKAITGCAQSCAAKKTRGRTIVDQVGKSQLLYDTASTGGGVSLRLLRGASSRGLGSSARPMLRRSSLSRSTARHSAAR